MNRTGQVILVVAFSLFLFAPLVAQSAGVEGEQLELRNLAEPPEMSPSDLLDASTYRQFSAYLTDHMPFRIPATRAEAWVDVELFHDPSHPDLVFGKDGWWFFDDYLTLGCDAPVDASFIRHRVDALQAVTEASGRQFRFIVAPGKPAIYPEYLTDDLVERSQCSIERRTQLQAALRSDRSVISLWDPLLSEKAKIADDSPEAALYFRRDTHWTPRAASVMVREAVNSLSPGLWDDDALVQRGTDKMYANLRYAAGLPGYDDADQWVIERPGVTFEAVDEYWVDATSDQLQTPDDPTPQWRIEDGGTELVRTVDYPELDFHPVIRVRSAAHPGVEMIPGNTFILHDSFVRSSIWMFPTYFEDTTFAVRSLAYNSPWLIDGLADADTFMFEIADFGVWDEFVDSWPMLSRSVEAFWPDLERYVTPSQPDTSTGLEVLDGGGWRSTNDDPQLQLAPLAAAADDAYRLVVLDVSSNAASTAELFYAATGETFNAEQRLTQPVETGRHRIVFDLSAVADTSDGEISLRIDPAQADGVTVHAIDVLDVPR